VPALLRLYPATGNVEEALLAAFDMGWQRITSAAEKIYRRGPRAFYTLTASDFA